MVPAAGRQLVSALDNSFEMRVIGFLMMTIVCRGIW